MNLKIIMVNKRSQKSAHTHTHTHTQLIPVYKTRKYKLIYNDRKQISGCLRKRDTQKGRKERLPRNTRGLEGDEYIILTVITVSQVYICQNIKSFMWFIVCPQYFNKAISKKNMAGTW